MNIIITFSLLGQLLAHPVIGILTIPSDADYTDYPSTQYSYLAASYVKFIENAGAQVVPIPYEADEDTLDKYFDQINGILFTGGTLELEDEDGPTKYTQSVAYLLERAILANDIGDYFPIMGICLGHQTIQYIMSGYKSNVLSPLSGLSRVNQPIQILKENSLFYANLNEEIYNAAITQDVVYFYTSGGVLPDFYKTNYQLQTFFDITAYSKDKKGDQFIASTQSKHYPIYTTQYHPEKSQFEWNVPANHTRIPVSFGRSHANSFVSQARQNTHTYDVNQLKQQLIYNYQPIQLVGASFVQIYFFKNGQLTYEI